MSHHLPGPSRTGEFSPQKKVFLLSMLLLFSLCGGVDFYCFVVIFDTSAQHPALHTSSFLFVNFFSFSIFSPSAANIAAPHKKHAVTLQPNKKPDT